jgi:hypothetical protein
LSVSIFPVRIIAAAELLHHFRRKLEDFSGVPEFLQKLAVICDFKID